MKRLLVVLGLVIIAVALWYAWARYKQSADESIGGQTDAQGCLVAAGYSWSGEVGACVRAFDMTPDIARAAKIAVDHVGASEGLAVDSFNSYEEPGAYDIVLVRGAGGQRETVYIRDWKVVTQKIAVFTCDDSKSITATFLIGYDKHVDLLLSDGRTLTVPRAISASGARYANDDESFVFWNKGDTAFITENGTTTFAGCTLKE